MGRDAHEPPGDGIERLAEAIAEWHTQTLPVVGQEDDPVFARRLLGHLDQRADGAVEAVERIDGLDALRPDVVGECVVAGVVHVDGRSAGEHLLDHECRRQVPQRNVGQGALEGVVESAGCSGLDAPRPLAFALVQLLCHLAEGQHGEPEVVHLPYPQAVQLPRVVAVRL